MKTTHLSLIVAALVLLPRIARADMAREMCMNDDALIAEKILAANVIVVATVAAVDTKEGKLDNGHWTFSWTAKISIKKVLHGTLSPKELTLSSSCTGLPNTSRNHCAKAPPKSDKPSLLFLRKDDKGAYHLVVPTHVGRGSCPGDEVIAKAKKASPGLLDEVKKAQAELTKAAATPKVAKKADPKPSSQTASSSDKDKPAAPAKKKGWCAIASSDELPWTFLGILGIFGLFLGFRRARRA